MRKHPTGPGQGTASRIAKPARPPHFSTDSRGFLVASFHDLQIDVPARPWKRGVIGPPAKIYRIKMPNAELAASYHSTFRHRGRCGFGSRSRTSHRGAGRRCWRSMPTKPRPPRSCALSTGIVIGALGAPLRSRPFELFPDQSPASGLHDPVGFPARRQRLGPRTISLPIGRWRRQGWGTTAVSSRPRAARSQIARQSPGEGITEGCPAKQTRSRAGTPALWSLPLMPVGWASVPGGRFQEVALLANGR